MALMIVRPAWKALLAFTLWIGSPSSGIADNYPVVTTPFDVTRKNTTATIDFTIKQARSYVFGLQFTFNGTDDEHRVADLVGTSRPNQPGIDLPVEIKLFRLKDDDRGETLLFDKLVVTSKYYAHGLGQNGKYSREILTATLERGKYRVEATSIDDSPAFSGTPSYLLIDFYANLQFVPKSFVPGTSP